MEIEKRKNSISDQFASSRSIRWVFLAVLTIIFAIMLTPNLVSVNHNYLLGDVADRDIKAPKDFFIEDEKATEANRKKAVDKVLTVYDHDDQFSAKASQRVENAFAQMRAVIQKRSEKTGGAVSGGVENRRPEKKSSTQVQEKINSEKLLWQQKPEFEKKTGFTVSKATFKVFMKEGFSEESSNFIARILTEVLGNGVVTSKEILLKETRKGITLRSVETKKERVVSSLKQIYGLDQAKTMVRIVGQPLLKDHNHILRNFIVEFVQKLIQPNITLNKSETEERKKKAETEIKPVLYKIKAGEMILREGERVKEIQLLKLKSMQVEKKKEQLVASSGSAAIIILCLLMTTYILHSNSQTRRTPNHNKDLLFITSVMIISFFLIRVFASLSDSLIHSLPYSISTSAILFGVPVAAAAMSIGLFLGLNTALPFALVLAVCTGFIFQNRFELFIYFLINSTMAAYWIQNCRERKVLIKAGLKLGFLNIVLATSINIYLQNVSGVQLLWESAFAFMGGIGAGIIAAGIAPIIEIAFGYTTDATLLELSNLDRPILRRLMIEAPGTYHHSVIVGSMVEAAASDINANSLLAKVCGYYHDIGKVKQPLYFIENQANGRNRHDKLAPSMSSLILIAHIKTGVEVARENRLGQEIIDTIRQHHGTSLIQYFYEKAKQLKGEGAVNIDNFRYPGPKPQTREAGLVMLADVIEAASRTLENPTPSRIQGLVQTLINKVFSDGQLDNCELTLRDLDNIAKIFNKILNGIYHHRIEYFEGGAAARGKGKNGNPDRKQAKQNQDAHKENGTKGPGHLKRLGLS